MAFSGKIIFRLILVLCIILIALGDYSGLLEKIFKADGMKNGPTNGPRPTNPGYGDVKPEIDLDADIEEDTIKKLGK